MYFAHYKSSSTGQSGCIKEFVTPETDHTMFPPQVSYACNLCKISHGFRLARTHIVNTPSMRKQFDTFCVSNHIERDVEVPIAKK